MTIDVTDKNYDAEVENASGYVFIDFWAPWCGPCKMTTPAFEAAEELFPNVKFVKVNVDEESHDVVARYQVRGIPALFLVKDSSVIARAQGAQSQAQLVNLLTQHTNDE